MMTFLGAIVFIYVLLHLGVFIGPFLVLLGIFLLITHPMIAILALAVGAIAMAVKDNDPD